MESKHLDLVEIARIIYRKKWFVLIFGITAAILGLICSVVATKQYTSRTVFIVKSPSILDRNQVFRQGYYQAHEYFGNEIDVDNVMTIAQNRDLERLLVDSFNLAQHYGAKDREHAINKLHRNFKITRDDTRSIEFRVWDKNPQMAADIANAARILTARRYREFFSGTRKKFIQGLNDNIEIVDQDIANTDDSIQKLRSQYGLFNVLLPTRGETIQNPPPPISPDKVQGMEILQRLTEIKDKLVDDRARYSSLINEYSFEKTEAGTDLFYPVETGQVQNIPSFPNIPLILGICLIGGFIFAIILILISAQIKMLNQEK